MPQSQETKIRLPSSKETLLKMSSKCPEFMTEIKGLVPWLHEHKIHLEVVYIHNEANLADASSQQRGLDLWSL